MPLDVLAQPRPLALAAAVQELLGEFEDDFGLGPFVGHGLGPSCNDYFSAFRPASNPSASRNRKRAASQSCHQSPSMPGTCCSTRDLASSRVRRDSSAFPWRYKAMA